MILINLKLKFEINHYNFFKRNRNRADLGLLVQPVLSQANSGLLRMGPLIRSVLEILCIPSILRFRIVAKEIKSNGRIVTTFRSSGAIKNQFLIF